MKRFYGFLLPQGYSPESQKQGIATTDRRRKDLFMRNIMTQRLALGVLTVLVLAFGVLGTADALEFNTSTSGDLQTVGIGEEFDIRFSVRLDRDIKGESISINPGGAEIKEVGRYTTDIKNPHVMFERDHGDGDDYGMEDRPDSQKLSGTVTLTLTAATAEQVTITIMETGGDAELRFTIYVVQDETAIFTDVEGITFVRQALVSTRDDNEVPISFTVKGQNVDNVPVTLTVNGSGRLFIKETYGGSIPDSESRSGSRLETSSAASGNIFLDVNGGSSRITIEVTGTDPVTGVFIFGVPKLNLSNDDQTGVAGGRLANYLGAQLIDSRDRPISHGIISFDGETGHGGMFLPVPGTTVYVDTANNWAGAVANIDDTVTAEIDDPDAAPGPVLVQTNSSGEARVYYQLDDQVKDDLNVIALAAGLNLDEEFTVKVDAATEYAGTLTIASGDGQSASTDESLEKPLIVRLETGSASNRRGVPGETITFTTNIGLFELGVDGEDVPGTSHTLVTGTRATVVTNSNGEAGIGYNIGVSAETREVTARVTLVDEDLNVQRTQEVRFGVNGRARSTPTPTTPTTPTVTPQASNILIISGNGQTTKVNSPLQPFVVQVNDQTGAAMDGVSVTFTNNSSGSLSSSSATTNSSGRASTTLTLGSTAGAYTVQASAAGVTFPQTFTAIAQAPILAQLQALGETSRSVYVGSRITEPLEVRVLDTDSDPVEGVQVTFTVVSGGTGTATPLTQSDTSDTEGAATAYFTPTAVGTIMIDAAAVGLPTTRFTLTASLPPSKIMKVSGDDQAGAPGKKLTEAFVVEIQDANGTALSGITVKFDVTAGGGSVSPASATTDVKGQAKTTLTLGTERGKNSVDVLVEGVATFATFNAVSGSLVHIAAAQRPALYWVDTEAGTLHRLIGDRVENLAASVRNATSLTIDAENGYIYWTSMTNPNKGSIRRAGLNGRGAQTLKALTSLPIEIAVNAGTLYWTNSRGRIQSMPAAGGKITNIVQNLSNPMAIAVSGDVLYWTEAIGRVRKMNLTGKQKATTNIATGLGEPIGIAVAGGKVYWTEKTTGNAGKIMRVDLDGTNRRQVKNLASGPIGISVDTVANKLYWTNSRGRIQRSNLGGSQLQNVVTDLVSPGALALETGTADTPAVEAATPQRSTPAQPTTYSKYDVNRDGAVNNADTKIVAGAVGQSGNSIINLRTDVNKDGTVDVTDLILVIGNLDDDAAAPAVVADLADMNLNLDRIQEQIEMLLSSDDRSHAAQRALLYLRHLLASARPDATVLLANYPNPFNPETWIPYHLANTTDVKINIYDAQGKLVRELLLGHQSAGYYTSRSRAAYWDGRNALGERVASGIYFYQLLADEISPMRKMVILK